MNKRVEQLAIEAFVDESTNTDGQKMYTFGEKKMQLFAELIVRECANELRDAEQEADRAYRVGEVKERMELDGYAFAEMLEERFGVEE